MRAVILSAMLCGAAPILWSQTRVYVSAPTVRVTCGDSMQLTALARNTAGDVIPNASFQWSSSNPDIAQVDGSGKITATSLGLVDITALSSGTNGVLRLQVLPQRIDVTPANLSIAYGSQQQFTAAALDSHGQPIPNVSFVWHLGLFSGGDSTTVSMRNGMVNATTLGYFLVRAAVVYPNSTDQFQVEFDGQTPLKIIPPDKYKLTRRASNDYVKPQFSLRGRRTSMAAADDGTLYFSAILDGMANGLFELSNGKISPVITAGTPSFYPGAATWDFDDPSVDSSGNIVARMANIGSGNMVVLLSNGAATMLAGDGMSSDVGMEINGIYCNRNSLSDNGDVVFRANFHYENSTVYQQGLFRYSGGFLSQELSVTGKLPGSNGTPNIDNQFGIDSDGVLSFIARGSTSVVYRKEPGADPVRLLALGDMHNGFPINGIYQLGFGRNGDLYVYGSTNGGPNYLAVFSKGRTTPRSIALTGYINNIYDANSAGAILFNGDVGGGYGLYYWIPAQTAPAQPLLLRGRPMPGGEPLLDIYSATLDSTGRVYAAVRGVNTPWLLMSARPSAAVLATSGDPIFTNARLNVSSNHIPGDKSGPFHVLAGGNQSSILEITRNGIQPLAVVNDKFPAGGLFTGTNPARKSASGSLYLATDQALYRRDPAGITGLVALPLIQDGINVNSPFNLAVNDHKQVAFVSGTNAGHQRLLLLQPDGQTQTLAYFSNIPPYLTPSPGGGTFLSLSELALGESGGVMISTLSSDAPGGLFYYDGSRWQTVCQLQNCSFDGEPVTSIGQLKNVGDRFCASFNNRLNVQSIRCWENGSWTLLLKRGDFTSDGTEVNSIQSFDINRNGDLAVVLFTLGLGGPSVFLKRGDEFTTVNANLFPLDGVTFRSVFNIDLRDDGRIFFTAMDFDDRMLVYEADPNL